jgi:hypothetical protein
LYKIIGFWVHDRLEIKKQTLKNKNQTNAPSSPIVSSVRKMVLDIGPGISGRDWMRQVLKSVIS